MERVFWDLVSILFKPRPQTSRKPFIMLYREGNMGKNRADHVATSPSPSPDLPLSLLPRSVGPGNTHWDTQTAPTRPWVCRPSLPEEPLLRTHFEE